MRTFSTKNNEDSKEETSASVEEKVSEDPIEETSAPTEEKVAEDEEPLVDENVFKESQIGLEDNDYYAVKYSDEEMDMPPKRVRVAEYTPEELME